MFNPSRDQVRDFFIDTWKKHQEKTILTPLESLALNWILQHPEYHHDLEDPEARTKDYSVNQGQVNPFLHLSMHLAIEEQLSINSPPGIKDVYQNLAARSSPHDAVHEIMECLGVVIWESQRLGKPLDNDHYLELLKQRVHRH